MTIIKLMTKKGLEKQTECLLDKTLFGIKYIAVGDGNGITPIPTDSDTALVHECWRGEISEIIDEAPKFSAITNIPEDVGDFVMREMGVFDSDNNLLFVSQLDGTPKSTSVTNGLPKEIGLKAIFELSDGLSPIIIDPSMVTASTDYVNTKIDTAVGTLNTEINNAANKNLSNLSDNGNGKLTSIPLAICASAGTSNVKEINIPNFDLVDGAQFAVKHLNKNESFPIRGKDFGCNFENNTASDIYGLNPITFIGTPTISNNVATLTGTNGFLLLMQSNTNSKFCIQCGTKTANGIYQNIFHNKDGAFGLTLAKNAANLLQLWLSSDGASHNIASAVTGTKSDWSPTTVYYYRLRFTGSQYLVEWTTDWTINGIEGVDYPNWTVDITINSASLLYLVLNGIRFSTNESGQSGIVGTLREIYICMGNDKITPKSNSLALKVNGITIPIANEFGLLNKNNIYNNVGGEEVRYRFDGANAVMTTPGDGTILKTNISLNSSLPIGTAIVDLSSILPNNNFNYELKLYTVVGSTNSHSICICSSHTPGLEEIAFVEPASTQCRNTTSIIIGTDRKLGIVKTGYAATASSLIQLYGYRRVS